MFELNGEQYSLEQVQEAAKQSNLSFEGDGALRIGIGHRYLERDGVEIHPCHLLEDGDPIRAATLDDPVADRATVRQRALAAGDDRHAVGRADDHQ